MTKFEIIEAREYHCGQIVRRLRENQRVAVMGLGVNPHREIRRNFDLSSVRKAWLVDGQLGAVWGITGPLVATKGYCWLALSERGTRYPIEVVKETRRQIAAIMQTKQEIFTTLLPEDKVAMRFADWLGFEVAHTATIPYGTGRVIAIRYRHNFAEAA